MKDVPRIAATAIPAVAAPAARLPAANPKIPVPAVCPCCSSLAEHRAHTSCCSSSSSTTADSESGAELSEESGLTRDSGACS